MVGAILAKDLRRLRSNWVGFLVLLAMPLGITALVGFVFGPRSGGNEVPRIKLAIVDEDQEILGNLIVSAVENENAREFFDAVSTDRAAAMELINANQLGAVVIVPADFSDRYFAGESTPPIEVIKNPAQTFMPAIAEELVRVLTTGLDAVALNLADELPEVSAALDDDDDSGFSGMTRLLSVATRLGDRFEASRRYLFPPIIGLKAIETPAEPDTSVSASPGFNVFAYVMPGLVAMFLLFSAESAAKDIIVERRGLTLMRYRTLAHGMLPFFVAKAIYALLVTLLAAAIMWIGGSWIFGIDWQRPIAVSLLTSSYAIFAVGFAFALIAVIFRERLIAILTTVVIMIIAFFGGSMLPADSLPPLIRDSISPWMPNHAFAQAINRLQYDLPGPDWVMVSLTHAGFGLVLLFASMKLFHVRLQNAAPT